MKFKLTFLLVLICTFSFAQDNKAKTYKQKSDELKQTIWQSNTDIFASNAVPDKYKGESAVVLGRSFEMQRTSNSKFKFMGLGGGNITKTNRTTVFREKVKINDKAALESFSKLEYEKIVDRTQSFLFSNMKNKAEVFVGVKVIKADGNEQIINTDEEVLLSSNNKDQTAKLAIPGLQIGDIVDYYICTIKLIEGLEDDEANKYFFFLADEYHVLKYSYVFQYNKKVRVNMLCANGAAAPVESSNGGEDIVYTFKGENMPKLKEEVWSSWYKNIPYFTVSSNYRTKLENLGASPLDKFDNKKSILENRLYNYGKTFNAVLYPFDQSPQKKLENKFKAKELKSLPLDSTMKIFYDHWRYNTFFTYDDRNYEMGQRRNYWRAFSRYNAAAACQMLCDMKIPHDLIVTTSKYSNTLENVFDDTDFDVLLRINGSKPLYMAFERFNTRFNELPSYYEGQKALILTPTRHSAKEYTFTSVEATLPVSAAEHNKIDESLVVNFPTDMQTISVKRNVKQQGHMRLADQLGLLLMEDTDAEMTKMLGGEEMKKRTTSYNVKQTYNNLMTSIADARKAVKDNFSEEIRVQYDQAPKELSTYKIVNSGVTNTQPFEYETTFTMDGFVKRAGSNYIFNVGKLIGTINKFEQKDRTRETDIVMPSARTLNYQIAFDVPSGYDIKGLADLNTELTNKIGTFKVTSSSNANKVTLNVSRKYAVSSAPKGKWNELLALLDAAYDFTEKKVLFEKTGK